MVHTTSRNNIVYSVDMMFSYINIFKPKIHKIDIKKINYNMNYKGWDNISPNDVLNNPKKYKDEYDRIKNANLKYPIIMDTRGNIYDGVHRYCKSILLKKKRYKSIYFRG